MKKKKTSLFKMFVVIACLIAVLGPVLILKPLLLEKYCENKAKKIVGDQWDKLYPAEGYEKAFADQITWGFREQLKCEKNY